MRFCRVFRRQADRAVLMAVAGRFVLKRRTRPMDNLARVPAAERLAPHRKRAHKTCEMDCRVDLRAFMEIRFCNRFKAGLAAAAVLPGIIIMAGIAGGGGGRGGV